MTQELYSTMIFAWGALAFACLSPGANMVAVASQSLASGLKYGLLVATGLAIGAFFWACAAILGLAALFRLYPVIIPVFSICGGGYLLYLGFKGLKAAKNSQSIVVKEGKQRSALKTILFGLSVTASNPKVGLLWISLTSMISAISGTLSLLVLFALSASLIVFIIYGAYAIIFALPKIRALQRKFDRAFTLIFGLIFCALGLRVIWFGTKILMQA